MNLFDAIFVRKSVRSYLNVALDSQVLDDILRQFGEINGLFDTTESELVIWDNTKGQHKVLGLFGVRAPYYLALYSEDKDRAKMNAGYLMEQVALYLCCKGLGSCFVGSAIVSKEKRERNNKKLMLVMAFGKAQKEATRRREAAKRLPMEKLCAFKDKPKYWTNQLLEVARLAPSSMNSQPWRFVVLDNRMHVYSKKQKITYFKQWDEVNFGILFSHMMVAAEEMWIDVDLIRLEEVAHKQFPNTEYVMSAVLKS